MKKVIMSMLIMIGILVMCSGTLCYASIGESRNDVFMEYFSSMDEMPDIDGMYAVDLTKDLVPELLSYTGPDKNGGAYCFETMYYFDGEKIVELKPWGDDKMYMNHLPKRDIYDVAGGFSMAVYDIGFATLCSCYIPAGQSEFVGYNLYFGIDNTFQYEKDENVVLNTDYILYNRFLIDSTVSFDRQTDKDAVCEKIENLLDSYDREFEENTSAESKKSYIERVNSGFIPTEGYIDLFCYPKSEPTFKKVSSWAEQEVRNAFENVMFPYEMYDDDLTQNITRAEFAAISFMLDRKMHGEEISGDSETLKTDFEGHEYEKYIMKAYKAGITNGTAEPTEDMDIIFSPDDNITREEMATMLGRVIKKTKYMYYTDVPEEYGMFDIQNPVYFEDDSIISDYAWDSIYFMSENGIIRGVDDTHFSPETCATREQALALVARIWDMVTDGLEYNLIKSDEQNNREIPDNLPDEAILRKLKGNYTNVELINKLKETGDINDSYIPNIYIKIDGFHLGYDVVVGDNHQGVYIGQVKSVDKLDDGRYCIIADGGEYIDSCKILYRFGEDKIECIIEDDASLYSSGEVIEFIKLPYDGYLYTWLGCYLFDGKEGVEITNEGDVILNKDNKAYYVYLTEEYLRDIGDNIIGADGGVYLKPVSGEEGMQMMYRYDSGVVTIFNNDGSVFERLN